MNGPYAKLSGTIIHLSTFAFVYCRFKNFNAKEWFGEKKEQLNKKKERFSKQHFLNISLFSTILGILIGIIPLLHSQPYWALGHFQIPDSWQFIHNNPFVRNFEHNTIYLYQGTLISTGLIFSISFTLTVFHQKLLSGDERKRKLVADIMHGALFFAYPSAIQCIVYSFREQNNDEWISFRNNPWKWKEEEAKKAHKYATAYIRYFCVFTLIATVRMMVYSVKFVCTPEDPHNKRPSRFYTCMEKIKWKCHGAQKAVTALNTATRWFGKQYFLNIMLFDSFFLLITTILPWALSYKGVVHYWFYFHENRFFLGGCPNATNLGNEKYIWRSIQSCFSLQFKLWIAIVLSTGVIISICLVTIVFKKLLTDDDNNKRSFAKFIHAVQLFAVYPCAAIYVALVVIECQHDVTDREQKDTEERHNNYYIHFAKEEYKQVKHKFLTKDGIAEVNTRIQYICLVTHFAIIWMAYYSLKFICSSNKSGSNDPAHGPEQLRINVEIQIEDMEMVLLQNNATPDELSNDPARSDNVDNIIDEYNNYREEDETTNNHNVV